MQGRLIDVPGAVGADRKASIMGMNGEWCTSGIATGDI